MGPSNGHCPTLGEAFFFFLKRPYLGRNIFGFVRSTSRWPNGPTVQRADLGDSALRTARRPSPAIGHRRCEAGSPGDGGDEGPGEGRGVAVVLWGVQLGSQQPVKRWVQIEPS